MSFSRNSQLRGTVKLGDYVPNISVLAGEVRTSQDPDELRRLIKKKSCMDRPLPAIGACLLCIVGIGDMRERTRKCEREMVKQELRDEGLLCVGNNHRKEFQSG